ncbi:hypothetical protein [Kitasatospora aureofaciens]|uniref:hypothetical protein n=1 Tax=Kitasatospora aureofaciens TaxID=1894 RepID=UPI0005248B6E|nr:hypothetical protein [Kitasatospora aureofaciens]
MVVVSAVLCRSAVWLADELGAGPDVTARLAVFIVISVFAAALNTVWSVPGNRRATVWITVVLIVFAGVVIAAS